MHTLRGLFTDIADAIRAKTGDTALIAADDFPDAIAAIPSGGGGVYVNAKATELGANALRGCELITECEYTICASVGATAFRECRNLQTVRLPAATTLGSSCFLYCTALTAIDSDAFPVIASIGSQCFRECSGIQSVSLQGKVNVGNQAFQSCTSLTTARFERVEFGSNVFYDSSLADLYITGDVVCSVLNSSTLAHTPIDSGNGRIHVPASLVSAYKAASVWNQYAAQIVAI